MNNSSFDVVIAGAGPVGLLLASELRLGGASVLVLEQSEESGLPLKQLPFGMRGLSIPTVEALYRRGLLDTLRGLQARERTEPHGKTTPAAHWMNQARRPGGHFAGIQFFHDKIDSSRWPYRISNPASAPTATTMADIEAVLEQRAVDMGAEIRRGAGVSGFEVRDERVFVRAGPLSFKAGWLVGCDGGRSTVRKGASFEFAGTEPEFTGYSVEVELDDSTMLATGRHHTPTGMYTFQAPGTIAMVHFDGGAHHRSQPTTLEHVQSVLRFVSGSDIHVKSLKLATTWTDRAFQASRYRDGRVLLAGDAAHIHSPLGGQGLNLGLGDAMNLGWKLAATIRGDAPGGLLDTYFAERHPVGAKVLDWSRAQVGLMRPSASSRALSAIIRDVIETTDGATYFAERVWGASLRYDLGMPHPLVGHSVPDFDFGSGQRLATFMKSGKGLLVEFGADSLRRQASRWQDRLIYTSGGAVEQFGLNAVLVRPDGVVAWAGEAATFSGKEMLGATARWFGEPLNESGAVY